ncbi:unnamed protein product [marine sediment metagenome]|uniref:Uncharacterized protein n=1 Tax=marine sediment metagenome TaxID=412755 RepID=X0SKG7_9ZZZZ
MTEKMTLAAANVMIKLLKFLGEEHKEVLDEFFKLHPEQMDEYVKIFEMSKIEDRTLNEIMYG